MEPETEKPETDESTETPEVSAGIDSIADHIDDESPEPNQAAIDGFRVVREVPTDAEGAATTQATNDDGVRDRFGMPFDPKLHHANDDGTPKLFKGKLRRKRQSKIGTAGSPEQSTMAGPGQLTPDQIAKARLAGRVMADSFISVAVMVGGDEFQPMQGNIEGMKIDERAELRSVFANYCEAKNIGDFPPGIALAIGLTGYIGPRFAMPKTQTRTKRFALWLSEKWSKLRNRRNAAHADNRDNGKRENDAREAISDEATRERS